MSTLVISRVSALPNILTANSMYLVGKSPTELQLVVVGNNVADVRATPIGADIDAKIAAAIGSLDQTNTAVFAADIPARDALNLTKNSFVFVADATGDPSVKSGSATYFGHVISAGNISWTKVAEYESMDVNMDNVIDARIAQTFLNKGDLDKIGHDANGGLTFDGKAVGTVQAGTNEW